MLFVLCAVPLHLTHTHVGIKQPPVPPIMHQHTMCFVRLFSVPPRCTNKCYVFVFFAVLSHRTTGSRGNEPRQPRLVDGVVGRRRRGMGARELPRDAVVMMTMVTRVQRKEERFSLARDGTRYGTLTNHILLLLRFAIIRTARQFLSVGGGGG